MQKKTLWWTWFLYALSKVKESERKKVRQLKIAENIRRTWTIVSKCELSSRRAKGNSIDKDKRREKSSKSLAK